MNMNNIWDRKIRNRRIRARITAIISYLCALLTGLILIVLLALAMTKGSISDEAFLAQFGFPYEFVRGFFARLVLILFALCLFFLAIHLRLKHNGIRTGDLRRRLNSRAKALPAFARDDQGRLILSLSVRSMDDLFAPYSVNGIRAFHSDAAQCVFEEARKINVLSAAVLEILVQDGMPEDPDQAARNISDWFLTQYLQARRQWKQNMILAAAIAAVGFAFLIFMDMLSEISQLQMTGQLLEVLSSALLWAAVGMFFLDNRKNRKDMERCRMLADMEIRFLSDPAGLQKESMD